MIILLPYLLSFVLLSTGLILMGKYAKSSEIYKNLCEVLPGGVNSPVRSFHRVKQQPLIAEWGAGDTVYDADGNNYIDLCCSWGALIHGHAHPAIVKAAQERVALGSTFGNSTEIELRLAQKIKSDVPSIELIRFVSSGTEATMSAARLARGYTGKKFVIKFSGQYHGHNDSFLVQAGSGVIGLNPTSSSAGIPEDFLRYTLCLPFNNSEVLQKYLDDPVYKDNIAAVIIEPISGNMGVVPAEPAFLAMLREETKKQGIILIFDEVKCGYRMPGKTAQAMYGIQPDLTCFAKIIGGGFPAAAFGGKREIMEGLAPLGKVYQAGTLSGNPVAMAAGLAALQLLDTPGIYQELERKVRLITDPVNAIIQEKGMNACMQHCGAMFNLFFGMKKVSNMEEAALIDSDKYAEFFRSLFSQGIYISPSPYESWFVSTVHEEKHLEKARDAIIAFLKM